MSSENRCLACGRIEVDGFCGGCNRTTRDYIQGLQARLAALEEENQRYREGLKHCGMFCNMPTIVDKTVRAALSPPQQKDPVK